MEDKKPVWTGRKITFLGLPLSFTKYTLYQDKFIIKKGFLNIEEDQMMLYRIIDFKVKVNMFDRIFNCGKVCLFTNDKTDKTYVLKVNNPYKVRDLFSENVEKQKELKNLRFVEENDVD